MRESGTIYVLFIKWGCVALPEETTAALPKYRVPVLARQRPQGAIQQDDNTRQVAYQCARPRSLRMKVTLYSIEPPSVTKHNAPTTVQARSTTFRFKVQLSLMLEVPQAGT